MVESETSNIGAKKLKQKWEKQKQLENQYKLDLACVSTYHPVF